MKVVVIMLASVVGLGAAGCATEGAPSPAGFTPYYGPGSPPREKIPPERETPPLEPGMPGTVER